MNNLPCDVINKIYDDFIDLCLIDHKKKFIQTLLKIINQKVVNIGFRSEWGVYDSKDRESFRILSFNDKVTNGIIIVVKDGIYWKHKYSWMFFPDYYLVHGTRRYEQGMNTDWYYFPELGF